MNKVITINLNGRAYQLEEGGFDALRAYLDEASARLENDEGKAEIISDLEQAIAEKCDKVLSPYKTVVTNDEIKKIIDEMGPVEGGKNENASDTSNARAQSSSSGPKRLYLIREGAILAGVCTGLAAYFDIDVTLVRVIFGALTIITGGIWIAVYILLAFLLPYADTIEARAAAHGQAFKAQDIVDRAKERFEESFERFTGAKYGFWDELKQKHDAHVGKHWKHEMKQQRQQWKQQWRQMRRQRNPVYGMLRAIIALVWIGALISLIRNGAIFGWAVTGIPIWLAVFLLFVVFFMITGPLQAAQYGPYGIDDPMGKYYYNDPWDGFVGVLTAIFLVIAFGWAYLHVPEFYSFVHHPVAGIKEAAAQLKAWWKR